MEVHMDTIWGLARQGAGVLFCWERIGDIGGEGREAIVPLCGMPLEDRNGKENEKLENHMRGRAVVMAAHQQEKSCCRNGCGIKTASGATRICNKSVRVRPSCSHR